MSVGVHPLWQAVGAFELAHADDPAWLVAKLNFLALAHPGATIRVSAARRDGVVAAVTSMVPSTRRAPGPVDVIVDHPALGGGAEEPPAHATGLHRVARDFLGWTLYDELRQRLLERQLARAEARFRALPHVSRSPRGRSTSPAVIVGMYWLELGGAEKWAVSTLPLLRERGLTPVVIIDRRAPQRQLGAPELEGCVVVSAEDEGPEDREAALRALIENVGVRAVMIHHSDYLYDHLALIRELAGAIPIIDSTHVVEWETGGYPLRSAANAAFIDVHHVVSRSLGRYLERFGVAREAIVVAPLTGIGFTTGGQPHASGGVRTIGFVGRMARQKRPWLFIELLRRLIRRGVAVRAIVHGDGPFLDETIQYARAARVEAAVEFRSPSTSVLETYRDIDALVIASQNEGITLTAMEAIERGILVISADVGAQHELVAGPALLPRRPLAFLVRGSRLLRRLATDAGLRRAILAEQGRKAEELRSLQDADAWFRGVAAEWGDRVA